MNTLALARPWLMCIWWMLQRSLPSPDGEARLVKHCLGFGAPVCLLGALQAIIGKLLVFAARCLDAIMRAAVADPLLQDGRGFEHMWILSC